jgi:hypothetical protein
MDKKEFIKKFRASYEIKISPEGKYLTRIGGKVYVLSANSYETVGCFDQIKNPSHIAFSPNGLLMAIKNTLGSIAVFNLNEMTYISTYKLGGGDGSNIWFSADSKFIFNGDWEGNITKIDLFTKTAEIILNFDDSMIERIDYDSNKDTYYYHIFHRGLKTNQSYYSLVEWKYPFQKNKPIEILLPRGYNYQQFSYNASNMCYAFSTIYKVNDIAANGLLLIDSKDNSIINLIQMDISYYGMNWTSDGKFMCVVGEQSSSDGVKTVKIIRYSDFKCVKAFYLKYPCYAEFSLDDRFLLIGTWNNGYIVDAKKLIDSI